MKPLPARPHIDHLKSQAKDLLARYRRSMPDALDRLRAALPAARGLNDSTIAALGLRLRDAQSCIAREYGFASWADLKSYVEAIRAAASDNAAICSAFARLVYAGDIVGNMQRPRPNAAARFLATHPEITQADPWTACAAGDVATVSKAISTDPNFVATSGGPFDLPPLVATTHSGLLRLDGYRENLRHIAETLLAAGADPNQSVGNRAPPASFAKPSEDHRISALYGAAGQNHDAGLTRQLLAAGANPNDNESLYHSLEAPECTRLLLAAGATVTGTNALYRVLDFDALQVLQMLLARAEGASELRDGGLLFWAIRRRRSPAHIKVLLEAGADAKARSKEGVSAHVQALRYGLQEVAEVLRTHGAATDIDDDDRFIAACAQGDQETARVIQRSRPDLPSSLTPDRLCLLPELAAAGHGDGVRTMIECGWPIDVKGGDWNASALNHAVFRGDAALARFLLEHGASWRETHGFDDNACGTLSWASLNQPVSDGDWRACAEALVAHGMPMATRDPEDPDSVVVDGRRRRFSDEVTSVLLGEET